LVADPPRARLIASGGAFVAGVSIVFILFFYALRSVLQPVHSSTWLRYIAGTVVIVLALQVAEVIRLPLLMRTFKVSNRAPGRGGLTGGFLLGLCFAAGWTPCIGATLGAVLSSAITQGTTREGLLLVAVYCIGLGVPFLALAASMASARPLVQALNRHRRAIDLSSGAVLLVMGLLLLTGNLTQVSTWLSRVMPDFLIRTVTL
jgi:cytochrome c-type biogenesis protein